MSDMDLIWPEIFSLYNTALIPKHRIVGKATHTHSATTKQSNKTDTLREGTENLPIIFGYKIIKIINTFSNFLLLV